MPEDNRDFQVGNWVVHLPEGNYCTIRSLYPNIILEGALHDYSTTIEGIGKIEITKDKLQVCGFDGEYRRFIRSYNKEISVAVVYSHSGIHKLYKNDDEFGDVEYIHEVQNYYYKITGELLRGNLYGVQER